MRFIKSSTLLTVTVIFFLFLACATTSTKFSYLWKDKTYHEHPEKILVISAWPNPDTRKTFEDEFVMAVKDRKVKAVMSYTTMSYPVASDMDAIAFSDKAKEVGANTVLIDRRLGSTMKDDGVYVNTQTDVYDMTSNKLIFSTTAVTWVRLGIDDTVLIKSYIKDLLKKLSHEGLF
jgi:hypothetical protein